MSKQTPEPLNPYTLNLPQVSLIEASAGSGKTYNIVNLFLRLLLNLGDKNARLDRCLQAKEILVVTFTKAATAEMKQRIEAKLYDFLAYLNEINSRLNAEIAKLPLSQQQLWQQDLQRRKQERQLKREVTLAKLREQPGSESKFIDLSDLELGDESSEDFCQYLDEQTITDCLETIKNNFNISDQFYLKCLEDVIKEGRVGSCIKYLERELTNNEFTVNTIDGFCKASLNKFDFFSPVSSYKFEDKKEVFLKQALQNVLAETLKANPNYTSKELSEHIPLFNLPADLKCEGKVVKGEISAYFDSSYLIIEENLILNSFATKTEYDLQPLPDSLLTFVKGLIELYSSEELDLLASRYGITKDLKVEQLLASQQQLLSQWESGLKSPDCEIIAYEPGKQLTLNNQQVLDFAVLTKAIQEAEAGNEAVKRQLSEIVNTFPLITFEQSILQNLTLEQSLAWVKDSKLLQFGFDLAALAQAKETDFLLSNKVVEVIREKNAEKTQTTDSKTKTSLDPDCLNLLSLVYRQWLLFFSQRVYQEFLRIQEYERSAHFDTLKSELLRLVMPEDSIVRQQLRQQYKYAIIDEFQDTSPTQFKIFSRLFIPTANEVKTTTAKLNGFIMIGDPKQAIYEFRGADIFSYFNARNLADQIFTIQNNYRSSPSFIQSSNQIFASQRGGFHLSEIQYPIALPGQTDKQGIVFDGKEISPITLINIASFKKALGNKVTNISSAEDYQAAIISTFVKLGKAGRLTLGGKPLKASDICVLERSNDDLKKVERALRKFNLNVNANINIELSQSKADPLFKAFISFLSAVHDPNDTAELNKYLCSQLSGLTLGEAQELILDKNRLAEQTKKLVTYKQIWQEKGLLSLLQTLVIENKLLAQTKAVIAETTTDQDSESTTNKELTVEIPLRGQVQDLFNVVDYVIEKFPHCNSPLETLNFIAQLKQISRQEEENAINKSSIEDQDAINLMTHHKSKGLEFGLVFSTSLAIRGQRKNKNSDAQLLNITDTLPGLTDFYNLTDAYDYAFFQDLRLAERARLFYVVLTRAKYGVVTFFDDYFVQDFIADQAEKTYYRGNDKFLTNQYLDKTLSASAQFALNNQLYPLTYRDYLGAIKVSMKQGREIAHFLPEVFNKDFFQMFEKGSTGEKKLEKEERLKRIAEANADYPKIKELLSQPNFLTYDYDLTKDLEEPHKIALATTAKLTPEQFDSYLKQLQEFKYLATNPMISDTSLFTAVEQIIREEGNASEQKTSASTPKSGDESQAELKVALRQIIASQAASKAIASNMQHREELPDTKRNLSALAWTLYTNLKSSSQYHQLEKLLSFNATGDNALDSNSQATSYSLEPLNLGLNISYKFTHAVTSFFTENSSFTKLTSNEKVAQLITNLGSLRELFPAAIVENIQSLKQNAVELNTPNSEDYYSDFERNNELELDDEDIDLEDSSNLGEEQYFDLSTDNVESILRELPRGEQFGTDVHNTLEQYNPNQSSQDKNNDIKKIFHRFFFGYEDNSYRAALRLINDSIYYPIFNPEELRAGLLKSTREDPNLSISPYNRVEQDKYLKLSSSDFKRVHEWIFNIDMSNNSAGISQFLQLLQNKDILPAGDLGEIAENLKISGKLVGIVDLIMFGEKEVIILDYKTNNYGNQLTDYHPHLLCEKMIKSGYILQLYIYLTAVYSYVKNQVIPADKPELLSQLKFVGVYLFLRGMLRDEENYYPTGKYLEIPDLELLEDLSQALLPQTK